MHQVHVAFASLVVMVQSDYPRVAEELREIFGPMVVCDASATPVARVRVGRLGDGFMVDDPTSADGSSADDESSAAREAYHAVVKQLMRERRDLVWLHGAVVGCGGRAHILCGPSGVGKSTLVDDLVQRGWSYLSDEIAAIDPSSCLAYPFPLTPQRRIAHGTVRVDADAVHRVPKIAVDVPTERIARAPSPVAALQLLRQRHDGGPTASTGCAPGQAVLHLLRNSLNDTCEREQEIAGLSRLVSHVHSSQLAYSSLSSAAQHIHDRAMAARGAE
jgi:hypothetical protein